MSDPVAEPGVPTTSTNVPAANEKSVAAEAKKHVPNRLLKLAATPDSILLRLNKVLAAPGGLPAFLSTFNYTLYLLAYLETKSVGLRARLFQLLGRAASSPTLATATVAAQPSPIMNLALMIGSARTTLRLFGLIPMYAGLRQLLNGPKPGQDQVLYANSVTQILMYMTFQFLENVALLTDNKVLPARYTAKYTASSGGKTAKIYLWAYRAWLGGILCDLVRLGREAQLERNRRSQSSSVTSTSTDVGAKSDEQKDQEWWAQAVVPLSWLPMAAHVSVESGIPGFNVGVMGLSGFSAGLGKIADLWAKTAE